jgi:hypothetical protein
MVENDRGRVQNEDDWQMGTKMGRTQQTKQQEDKSGPRAKCPT